MLNTIDPLSLIITPVLPKHLSISVTHICLVISPVDVTAGPCKNSKPPFFIVSVLTVVTVAFTGRSFPHSLALSESVDKISLEKTAIEPVVLPVPRRFSIGVTALVHVSVGKSLQSLSMF